MASPARASAPSHGIAGDAAMLLLRLLLGAALCVGGTEKVGLGAGHCLRDPAPACEAEERALCADDADCRRLVPARCQDARAAACKDQRAAVSASLTARPLLGEPSWRLPGPGRLWLLGHGGTEALAGLLIVLGLWARSAAALAALSLGIGLLTTAASFDSSLAFLHQFSLLHSAIAIAILALGPGSWRMPALGLGAAGAAKGGSTASAGTAKASPRPAKA